MNGEVKMAQLLTVLDQMPDVILQAAPQDLHKYLHGPTLVHLTGRRPEPLFVSVLLHGNEHTGFYAVQALLRKYKQAALPRALSVFIGNIRAANKNLRRLDEQPDYNRVWPGTDESESEESETMQTIVNEMVDRRLFASIDIHNNTGLNPHYACVNRLENTFLQLATLFSRVVVYFVRPKGVQTAAFAQYCPAVTVECGKSGHAPNISHSLEYIEACLHLEKIPRYAVKLHDIDLFHTVAQVKVHENISFSFDSENSEILFNKNLDHLNFRELPAGTSIGVVNTGNKRMLHVIDEAGRDVSDDYFQVQNDKLEFKKSVMPSMLCLDEKIIEQDCLCYLMERIGLDRS